MVFLSIIAVMVLWVLPAFADVDPGELQGYDFCGGYPCPSWVNLTRGDMFFADGNDVYIIANISCANPPGENICNSSMTVDADFSQIGGSDVQPGVFKQNGTDASWAIFEFNDTVDFTSLSVEQIQPNNITMNATIFNTTSDSYETYDLPSFFAPVLLVNMSTFGCPSEGQPGVFFPEVPGWNASNSSPVFSPIQAVGCTQNVSLCSYMDTYGPGTWNGTHWLVCAPNFGGSTTNFTEIADAGNFSAIQNFTIEVPGKAKIIFQTNVSFDSQQESQAIMEFAMKSVMGGGRVGINDTEFCGDSCGQPDKPNLNLSARLTIYNVSGQLGITGNPQIIRMGYDGSNPQSCPPSICSDIIWDGENLTFTVSSFSSYQATDGINVSLVSPGNTNWTNNRTINFNYMPVWNDSMTMSNCTLFGNFTGSWEANETNSTPLSNGATNIISNTVNDDVAYLWNVECYDNTGLGDTGTTNYTVMVDSIAPTWSNQSYNTTPNYSSSTPSYFNISWSDANGISKVILVGNWSGGQEYEMNNLGGDVYGFNITLPAGIYYWLSYANDSSNYTNTSNGWAFIIGQASNPVSLYFNGTQNLNKTYTYPEAVNATGTSTVLTPSLYRDGASVGTDEQVLLGNGTYAYKINATGNANYSDNVTGLTYYALVNMGMPSTILEWNESTPVDFGFIINFTSYSSDTTLATTFYANYSGVLANISPATTGLNTNITDTSNLGLGVYQVAANTTGNANYSDNSTLETIVFTVSDISSPTWSVNQSSNPTNYSSTLSTFNVTWNDNTDISDVLITIRNSTGVLINNASMTNDTFNGSIYNYSIILPADTYNWTAYANDTSGTWNATDTWIFTISQANNPVSLYFNGTENANKTYTYPAAINATATSGGTVYLYRNGTHIANGTSPQAENILLGNNTYPYKVNATGNANYTSNSTGLTYYASVNKGTLVLMINATPSTSVTYPAETTVTGTENNINDTNVTYRLWRDATLVDNTTPYQEVTTLGGGTYVYRFNTTGNGNWTADPVGVTLTMTVAGAAFTPGGGSGTVPIPTKMTRTPGKVNITVPSISAGRTLNITIQKTEDIAFRKLSVTMINTASKIGIIITKLSRMPSTISHDIEGKVYHYINVEKDNITDADINRTIIRLAVNNTWLSDNNINSLNISLYRWEDTNWNELPTYYSFNDSFEYYYEAISPGFSVFAIGESGSAPEIEETACSESWSCTEWSECSNTTQTRTCTDSNSCGTTASKPTETQECGTVEADITVEELPTATIVAVALLIVIVIAVLLFLKSRGKITVGSPKEDYY
ncbi:MAG: PGF-pre-PGF domain-containing protein [Candidatus Aenigmatarchaeota archaeon]